MTLPHSQDTNTEARDKLTHLFRYLQALNELRHSPAKDIATQLWELWFHDLPIHPCVERGMTAPVRDDPSVDEPANDSTVSDTEPADTPFILRIRRPSLTPTPEPPASVLPWLAQGWQHFDGTVMLAAPDDEVDPSGAARAAMKEPFDAHPERVRLLGEWTARRQAWVESERPARHAMAIYERLYELHTRLERESERLELMLGDGILRWDLANGAAIHHPVLLLRLQLIFDPEIPQFTLVETDHSPELYTAIFRDIAGLNTSAIRHCRDDLEQGGWHPLGGAQTSTFLHRFATELSPHGTVIQGATLPARSEAPCIARDPIVFVRERMLGFGIALEAILEDLADRADLPTSLLSIVGIERGERAARIDPELATTPYAPNGEDEEILLSKPANAEQLEIARQLARHDGVLVQGPPGTGKTHTIANLIGHLLADGKSILVTSHTTKALKVLREHVVEALQPLCVSALDDSRTQMEHAIDAITERLSSSNAETLEREAATIRQQRNQLITQLRHAREQLMRARGDEYRPVVFAGLEMAPSVAARRVADGRASSAWIPSPVVLGEPLPLSPTEVADLYHSNAEVTSQDEGELAFPLPEPDQIIPPAQFARLLAERRELRAEDLTYRRDLWQDATDAISVSELSNLQRHLAHVADSLQDTPAWRLAAIDAGRAGGGHRQAWVDLVDQIEATYHVAAQVQPLNWRYDPVLPDACDNEQAIRILADIVAWLKGGGQLNRFKLLLKPDWKTLIAGVRVQGHSPQLIEHFDALFHLAHLRAARQELWGRWQRQMAALGAPELTATEPTPEESCFPFVAPLRACLSWYQAAWLPLEQHLTACGLRWSQCLGEVPVPPGAHAELRRLLTAMTQYLPSILSAQLQRTRYRQNEATFQGLTQQLARCTSGGVGAAVVDRLLTAVQHLDARVYQDAYDRLISLHRIQVTLAHRRDLLARLERVAPGWTATLRARHGVHDAAEVPGDVQAAWEWRQLNDELDRRSRTSLAELQIQIAQLSAELRRSTADLVDKLAWAAQVRRTTLAQRQALQGWKELHRRVGKGKGVRAPRFQAEARRLMPECQSAVPVWIMPLSRVVENFDPRRNRFDVVIIDEASQADVLGLTALYLGRQVVVVGDHEQVSPLAVGQRQDEAQRLIDEHLVGIPNRTLYDGQLSVYTLAQTSFDPVVLREHFRCVTPIIEFSNRLSYQGKIKPLRDASQVQRRPHTVAYRVERSGISAHVNADEAMTVASLLVAASEQPEYADATFGVISMVDDKQAAWIEKLLRDPRHYPTAEFARRRIQCGDAASFQGDERDVMFLSMVDVPSERGPLALRTEGASDVYKKRFNVAASRARDQMWVVYSLDPENDLKPGDLRQRLIRHAQDPLAIARSLEAQEQRTESEFERLVLGRLMGAGYLVVPQWPVGAYRIDLVVEGSGQRLAVECDGDRWHPQEKLEDDMARQAILERLGWRFVRIRGSQFFRDPDGAMCPVFARLEELGIAPEGAACDVSSPPDADDALIERIKRRASALRREWATEGDGPSRWGGVTTPPVHEGVGRTFPVAGALASTSWLRDPSCAPNMLGQLPAAPPTDSAPTRSRASDATIPPRPPTPHQSSVARMQSSAEPRAKSPPALSGRRSVAAKERRRGRPASGQRGRGRDTAIDVIAYLRARKLEVIDKRPSGGQLWVVGGPGLARSFDELASRGYHFAFVREGCPETRHLPAWYLNVE